MICAFSVRYNGAVGEHARVTQKTMLRFTWHLVAEDFSEECDVQLLCRDVERRGVHVPKAWKSKWNRSAEVPAVDSLARAAVKRAREELSLSDATKLDCRLSSTNTRSFPQTFTHTHTHTHAHEHTHEHKYAYSSTIIIQI